MKILAGTDFHGVEKSFEDFALKAEDEQADVLLVSGDITHFGTLQQARDLLSLFANLRTQVLFVPGNCDPPSIIGVDVEGAKCIHGKSIVYDDWAFLGVGGSPPTPFSTPFEISEEEILNSLHKGVGNLAGDCRIILVSHSPPRDTAVDRSFLGKHAGSSSIRRYIEEMKPSLVFCGHIHEGKGKDTIDGTIVVNPGPARYGCFAVATVEDEISIEFGTFQ